MTGCSEHVSHLPRVTFTSESTSDLALSASRPLPMELKRLAYALDTV
jgi:hypothetical protein